MRAIEYTLIVALLAIAVAAFNQSTVWPIVATAAARFHDVPRLESRP